MRLTEEKALELTKELWDWLGKGDGRRKLEWPMWKKNGGKCSEMAYDCFLCEYSGAKRNRDKPDDERCGKCPYYQDYGPCYQNLFYDWDRTHSKITAQKFAHRLKVILHNKRNPENKMHLIGDTEFNEDTVKVMEAFYDFLGKTLHPESESQTHSGYVYTTPDYGSITIA